MQCLFLAVTLSLDFFHRFLTGGRWGWLAGAVFFYLLAALTYELTYLLWILHLGLLLTTRPTWARALAVAPFAAIPVLLTLGSLWLRALPGSAPGVYAMNLAPAAVADAALKQFVAALPGSYVGLDSSGRWHGIFSWHSLWAQPTALVLGFAGGALAAVGLARTPDNAPLLRRLLVLGLLLMVLPVPLIAVVQKYQGEALDYGVGYLPVYFQYFGVALVVACGAAALAGRVRNYRAAVAVLAVVLGALCGGVAALHSEANARVVQAICEPYLHPRCEVEEVLERGGLLTGAPEGAVVVAEAYRWDSFGNGTYFYCAHTRVPLMQVLPSANADAARLAELPHRPGPEGDGPPLLRVCYRPGFALAGKMSYLRSNANGVVTESGVHVARLAVARTEHGRPPRRFVLHAECVEFVGDEEVRRPVSVDSWRMRRAVDTEHWTVYNVDIPGPDLLAESVWLEDEPAALASTAP